MEDEETAPLMCAAATVAAGFDIVGTESGENVMIRGAGMLGFYAMTMARERQPKHIIVIDIKNEWL